MSEAQYYFVTQTAAPAMPSSGSGISQTYRKPFEVVSISMMPLFHLCQMIVDDLYAQLLSVSSFFCSCTLHGYKDLSGVHP
jgi:hypothetical protein